MAGVTNYPDGIDGSHPYFNVQDAECPECGEEVEYVEWEYCPMCGTKLRRDEYLGCSPYETMHNYRRRRGGAA